MIARINAKLDDLVRPQLYLFGRIWSAYQLWGYTGLFCGISLGFMLSVIEGLSIWILVLLVVISLTAFLAQVMFWKIITGKERLEYYFHLVMVLGIVCLVLWLLNRPILPYLDVVILALGTILTFFRVGCFMAGCCHGRPFDWGVCYRDKHVKAGFAPYYAHVRLFPAQIIESLLGLLLVLGGMVVLLGDGQSGDTLAWYLVSYACIRFYLEFWRGDTQRNYFAGFSELQWLAVVLVLLLVIWEWQGILTFRGWHFGVLVILLMSMGVLSLKWKSSGLGPHRLLLPRHVQEIAEILHSSAEIVIETSIGIKISCSEPQVNQELLTFSHPLLTESDGLALANLILQLKRFSGDTQLIQSEKGVWHLLLIGG